jgi:hypothetical protein
MSAFLTAKAPFCYANGMKDINQLAKKIVGEATEEKREKNPAAVALGRLGGIKGGEARAKKLTPEQRKEIAQKAAAKRWKK